MTDSEVVAVDWLFLCKFMVQGTAGFRLDRHRVLVKLLCRKWREVRMMQANIPVLSPRQRVYVVKSRTYHPSQIQNPFLRGSST